MNEPDPATVGTDSIDWVFVREECQNLSSLHASQEHEDNPCTYQSFTVLYQCHKALLYVPESVIRRLLQFIGGLLAQ